MSNAVYPTLPGLMFNSTRSPMFKTDIKTTPSGREFRGSQMAYPLYKYKLTYEFLRDMPSLQEFRTLLSFYTQMKGCFDSFLYNDPDDNAVTAQSFGIGDGATATFQLVRTLGNTVEPVYAVNSLTTVFISGTTTSAFSINSTGGVTFSTAPAAGAVLTWTGTYYWRCRFLTDEHAFAKMMNGIWETKEISFMTVNP